MYRQRNFLNDILKGTLSLLSEEETLESKGRKAGNLNGGYCNNSGLDYRSSECNRTWLGYIYIYTCICIYTHINRCTH